MIKSILQKSFVIAVAVMMAATCFAAINTDYAFAAKKKVTSVTLTNVGNVYTIKKGTSKKLKYSIKASKKRYKKVKWKSSDKKIVTVSKKGKIKAKKNGVAYVTVYSKTNKKIRDRVRIVVGTPVVSVTVDKHKVYVKKGKQIGLSIAVKPSDATNRNLLWTTSNKTVATVSQNGVVTGKKRGYAIIKAAARDGSGKYCRLTVKVVELKRSDAIFIAHRGYSSIAPENTLPAFALASRYNFHGAEMDVWESYSYKKEIDKPDDVSSKNLSESEPEVVIESESEDSVETVPEEATEPEPEDIAEPESEEQDGYEVQDEDLVQAKAADMDSSTLTVDAFDLNIMHNRTTKAMCGKSKNVDIRTVNDTNREQYPIKNGNRVSSYSKLYIPTLEEALKALYDTNKETGHETMPVIELKQEKYSAAAIRQVLDLIEQYGGKATIISFHAPALSQAQIEIDARVKKGTISKGDVQTQYLVTRNNRTDIRICVARHFDGISIKYTKVTKSIVDYAHKKGLIVAAWTMPSMVDAARMIDLGVDRVTSDYKLFID